MSEAWQGVPQLAPSEEQRKQAVADLNQAWQSGQITAEQFHERVRVVLDAQSLAEFAQVAPPANQLEPLPASDVATRGVEPSSTLERWAPQGAAGRSASIAIMGGSTLAGNWTVARHLWNLTVMGGTDIDLREAQFTAPVTVINVVTFWGGVDIIAPPDLNVEVQGIGVLGGFGWKTKRSLAAEVNPDGPKVIVRGVALMGGVEVQRKRRD